MTRPPQLVLEPPRRAARRADGQRTRRRRTARVLAAGALAVAALLALGWLLLASSWFAVDRVVVSGTSRLGADTVRAAAAVPLDGPLARVDTGGSADRVRALPAVREVEVRRRWPNTIQIRVRERSPVAGVAAGPAFGLLSAEGIAFARSAALPAGVPRLEVRRPAPDDPATLAALDVLTELPAPLHARVAAVRAATPARVVLVLTDGRRVVWGGPGDAAGKAAAATALLRLPGSEVDVGAPGVAVHRQ